MARHPPSMLSLLRRHFQSGVYTLGDFLEMQHWPVDHAKLDPREREIVDDMLKSYVVIMLSRTGQFNIWNDPREPLDRFLLRQRRPTGISCASTDLFSERWRLLDKAVSRHVLAFLFRTCIVLKAGQDGNSGAWIQICGRELSSAVTWPPREGRKSQQSTSTLGLSQIFYNRTLHEIHCPEQDDAKFPGIIIDTSALPSRIPEKLLPMIGQITKRARALRRTPWLPPSKKSMVSGRTPAHEVALIIDSVLWRLCPHRLYGPPQNWSSIRDKLKKLMALRRNETLTAEQLVTGLKTTNVLWLESVPGPERGTVFREFNFWFFSKVIVPIVAHYFYVTETSFDPSGVYFYRHNVWRRLEKQGLEVFREQAIQPLESYQDGQGEQRQILAVPTSTPLETNGVVGAKNGSALVQAVRVPSYVPSQIQSQDADDDAKRPRFIPKTHGVRAIMNLRNLRDQLKLPHVFLSRAWGRGPNAISSPVEFVSRLSAFQSAHATNTGSTFYFVKADVTACFDLANTVKLVEILERRLRDQIALVRNMRVVSMKSPKFARIAEKNDACYASEAPAAIPAPAPPGRVVVERKGQAVMGDALLADLVRLLTTLKVRLGSRTRGEVIRRNKGIPQGSSVSLDLCNILLDDFVKTQFADFGGNDKDSLLVRYVDDFLFISTNKSQAEKFLQKVQLSYPEYGVSFNPAKISTNIGNDSNRVTFLGETVDVKSLQISVRPNIRDCSTTDTLQTAYRRLRYDLNFVINILRASQSGGKDERTRAVKSSLVRTIGSIVSARLNACGIGRAAQEELFRTRILRLVPANLRRQLCVAFEHGQRQFRAH